MDELGIDSIGCHDHLKPKGMNCNPYQGDTDCDVALPILCTKTDSSPRPPYHIYGHGALQPAAHYAAWNQGHIATTQPVKASGFKNRAEVDAFCTAAQGPGWKVTGLWATNNLWIPNMNETKYAGVEWTANIARAQYGGWRFYSWKRTK